MTRIREHLRKGAALALLALAIQLATSFAHIHHIADPASIGQAQAADHSGDQDRHTDEGCALCAVLSLAATSILPDAPQLDLPLVERARLSVLLEALLRDCRTPLFHARAPPLA